ncbi:hemophore-related protein [Mycobacterium sp. WMMD1722]|uniref:hemophore-related protein n=1 Tax=Mycobacterium sp. WMMD1722 TaxID=3404117 RepID=UPI003BF5BE49
MRKLSRTTLAVTLGGFAAALPMSMFVSAGAASAQDLSPIVNTTCSYEQVVAALNDQQPALANQLAAQPTSQAMLRSFLASPPPQRQATATQLAGYPGAQSVIGPLLGIAGSCNNY